MEHLNNKRYVWEALSSHKITHYGNLAILFKR